VSVLSLLQEVRKLLAEPLSWLHNGLYAGVRVCDSWGRPLPPRSCYDYEEPNCFCIAGALNHVGRRYPADEHQRAIRVVYELIPDGSPITEWNDRHRRRHSEVVALLDDAVWKVSPSPQLALFPTTTPAEQASAKETEKP